MDQDFSSRISHKFHFILLSFVASVIKERMSEIKEQPRVYSLVLLGLQQWGERYS